MLRHDSESWRRLLYSGTVKKWFKAIFENRQFSSWFCKLLFLFQNFPPEAQLNHETYAFLKKPEHIEIEIVYTSDPENVETEIVYTSDPEDIEIEIVYTSDPKNVNIEIVCTYDRENELIGATIHKT